jgi:hypothetical protein
MYWFKWLELFENDKEEIKVKTFIVQCNVANTYTKIVDFKGCNPYIYIILKLML